MARKWNPTCNRFVAFFDIMGFKEMMFRNSHAYVMRKMNAIREMTKLMEKDGQALTQKRNVGDNNPNSLLPKAIVLPVIFSDSILFVSEDDSKTSALQMLFEASFLLHFCFSEGIPLKGALAYGKQTADFNRSLHFGRPLIDAYELQDELHMYGVVLHHSMEKYLRRHNLLENSDVLCRCAVPLKSGSVRHYCIDTRIFGSDKTELLILKISEMYDTVSGSTRLYVDNTIDFVREIEVSNPRK